MGQDGLKSVEMKGTVESDRDRQAGMGIGKKRRKTPARLEAGFPSAWMKAGIIALQPANEKASGVSGLGLGEASVGAYHFPPHPSLGTKLCPDGERMQKDREGAGQSDCR